MAKDFSRQEELAFRVREHCLRMATGGGCFIGASLSCADILMYLYTEFLNVSPDRLTDPGRDYLFLSKGHDVPALYGTLAELGFFDVERLKNHLSINDSIYWHPNRAIPGIEFYSGSLGHLLSVSMGVAHDCLLRGGGNRVVVILGDGELNEGTIWEGVLVANAMGLGNLVAVVDRNQFQANIRTEELIPLEDIETKFAAFGWNTFRCDGHDFKDVDEIFTQLPANGKPTVVVADTVRGKGVPSIEARADRWFANFTATEVQMLIEELHGVRQAELTSETLIVR
jgi:transketolase